MIFYFSGTGNSYNAANIIAQGLDVPLVSMAEALKSRDMSFDIRNNKICGFVMPIHFWGVPYIVTEFIKNIHIKTNPDTYFFLVFTCGGATGIADKMFKRMLAPHQINISAVYSIQQIDAFVPIFRIPAKDKRDETIIKAQIESENIINHIKNRDKGDFNINKGILPTISTKLLYPIYSHYRGTSKFRVSDMCTACKKCENICPLNIIEIKDHKPVWKMKKCTLCFSCLHICPSQAINYGKVLFFFDSKDKGRYRNPYAPKGY